jgi:hypothetical protein
MINNGFPSSAEQLTSEWLTEVLRKRGPLGSSGSVAGFEVTPLDEPGQLAEVRRISLSYAGEAPGAPQTLVAKFPAVFEQARHLARQYGSYLKETRFYQQLAERTGGIVPVCYAAEIDAETHDFVLLLEDLGASRGGDFLFSHPGDVAVALENLATLHARWWDHPALDALDWPFRPDDAPLSQLLKATLSGMLPVIRTMFGTYVSDNTFIALEKAVELWDQIAAYQPGPHTICHGDCHLKQMMFPSDSAGRFVLLDWQTTSINWGAIDVGRTLMTSLSPGDRRAHERSLVQGYHRSLRARGIIDMDIDRLWFLIRISPINSFIINALACLQTDAEILHAIAQERGIDCYDVLLGRVSAAIDDWDLSATLDRYLAEARIAQAA